MKPIFCGNLDFDARQSDVERLFNKYGKVDRVDVKSGKKKILIEDLVFAVTTWNWCIEKARSLTVECWSSRLCLVFRLSLLDMYCVGRFLVCSLW